jgi:hypothetical protein
MNSMINGSKFLAAALCAAVLVGCNAVESVPDEPAAVSPPANLVLGGKIRNLGTRRALVLQLNGKDACLVPVNVADPLSPKKIDECRFLGVADQEISNFSFSAINAAVFPRLEVGTAYSITVKRQPFGKICTVQNPTGTLRATNPDIQVSCVDDPAVPHYTVSVNTSAVASRPGLRVKLTTENGTCTIDATGLPSPITFTPDKCRDDGGYHQNATYIFNNGLNLPHFQWQVTASIPGNTPADPPRNCSMIGGKVANTGGNTNDNDNSLTELGETLLANRPAGNESVTVASCGFTVTLQADYSRNFVPATTNSATNNLPTTTGSSNTPVFTEPTIPGGDRIQLALRSQPWGVDVAAANITSFATSTTPFTVPDTSGNPTGTIFEAQSDLNAFYEVVVKQSPAGMACVPGYSTTTGNQSTRSVGTAADAGAVLLRVPQSETRAQKWLINRVIRCRNIPANPAARLRGVYGQFTKTTTTTTTGSTGAVAVTAPTVRNRNFLTFFEDGTYLFGSHSGTVGVEQGFYAYNVTGSATAAPENQPANSINFIPTTETNGAGGINNAGAIRLITNVVKAAGPPKTITGLVSDGNVIGYVSAGINAAVIGGISNGVAGKTYAATGSTNLGTLVADINSAVDPGGSSVPDIAFVQGTEIRIVGPPGGVVFTGAWATDLGLPTTVAAGETVVSTNANARLTRTVRTVVEWVLEEVNTQDPIASSTDPKDGAWVSWDWQRQPAPVEDRRRVFVYQHGLYNAAAIGVNGIANFMEACYVDERNLSGSWTKQSTRSTAGGGSATSAGCSMRQYSIAAGETLGQLLQLTRGCTATNAPLASTCTVLSATSGDFPSTVGNVVMTDFPGRWPQSQAQDATDGRPVSLVDYELRPANSQPSDPVCPTVDKLTVWDTQHGIRKDTLTPPIPRIVLCRITAN